MFFARPVTPRSASSISCVRRIMQSNAYRALAGMMVFYGGMSVCSPLALAQQWSAGQSYPLSAAHIGRVVVGSITGPHAGDVAVVADGKIQMYYGDGTGKLSLSTAQIPMAASDIAVGPFSATSRADDLIVLGSVDGGPNGLYLLANPGTGSFNAPVAVAGPSVISGSDCRIIRADLNGDAYPDLIVTCSSAPTTAYLGINSGTGVFAFTPVPVAGSGRAVTSVTAGDVNGDGITDLLVRSRVDDDVNSIREDILLGSKDGSYLISPSLSTSRGATTLDDFDGDTLADKLTTASSGIALSRNLGTNAFGKPVVVVGDDGCSVDAVTVGQLQTSPEDRHSRSKASDLVLSESCGGVPTLALRLNTAGTYVKLTFTPQFKQARYKVDLTFTVAPFSGNVVPTGNLLVVVGKSGKVQTLQLVDGAVTIPVQLQRGRVWVSAGYMGDGTVAASTGLGTILLPNLDGRYPDPDPASSVTPSAFRHKSTVPWKFRWAVMNEALTPHILLTSSTTNTAGLSAPYFVSQPAGTNGASTGNGDAQTFPYSGAVKVGTSYTLELVASNVYVTDGYGDTDGLEAFDGSYTVSWTANGVSLGAPISTTAWINSSGTTYSSSCMCDQNTNEETDFFDYAFTPTAPGSNVIVANGGPAFSEQVWLANGNGGEFAATYMAGLGYSTATFTVTGKASPTITLACAPNTIAYMQNATCTAVVSGGATGTVAVTYNGNAWAWPALTGGTSSQSGFSGQPVGTYTVAATYSGDANNNAVSASTVLTISKASTVTTGSLSANPITYGQTFNGPVHVNCNSACGNVQYMLDGAVWGTATLDSNGNYNGAAGVLAAGTHAISANYLGDANHTTSSWTAPTLTINKATGVFSVTSSANPVLPGASVTFTCTATAGGQPLVTGAYMAFWLDGTVMENVTTTGGALQWSTSTLSVGAHNITCTGGDANYNSAGVNYTETIGATQATPAVSLACTPASLTTGQSTTCTASLPAKDGTVAFYSPTTLTGQWWNGTFPAAGGNMSTAPVAITHDGSLNYNDNGYSWPSVLSVPAGINASGIYARWTGTFVSTIGGTYTIGDNSDDGSNIYVNGTELVTNLTAGQGAAANLTYTQSGTIALTAGATNTIVVEYQNTGGPGGLQLMWTPPGQSLPSLLGWSVVPVNSAAQAIISGNILTAGANVITALWSGDVNFTSGSGSATVTATANTTTQLTSSANPTNEGQAVTFSALVNTGGAAPTANVNFFNTEANIGSGAVTPVSNTNYLPYSAALGSWGNSGEVITPNALAAPDETMTATQVVVGSGGQYYLAESFPCQAGANTFSAWMEQTSNPAYQTWMTVRYFNAAGSLLAWMNSGYAVPTSTWARYGGTTTGPVTTASCTVTLEQNTATGTTSPAGQGTYVWGVQFEQGSQPGPYIATNGSANSGYGGIASVTTSVLPAGNNSITAAYAGDTFDLTSSSAPLIQNVAKVTPTMSVTCTPNVITYSAGSSPLASCSASLSGGTGTVTFNGQWTDPVVGGVATVTGFEQQPAQVLPLVAVYSGDANYNTVTASTTLTINKATPTITWATPAPIVYGTALSATQLDATASVAGVFSYGPPAGTVLVAGAQPLTVSFAPTDATDYTTASGSVTLTVTQATPTITFPAPASPVIYGASPITLAATITPSGLPAVTFSVISGPGAITGGTTLTFTGAGTVVVAANEVGNTNYLAATTVTRSVVVNKSTPTVTASCTPNPLVYGLTGTTCTSSVGGSATGSIVWTIAGAAWTNTTLTAGATSVGPSFMGWVPGSYLINAAYSGDSNYAAATNSTTLTITQAPSSITWAALTTPVSFASSTQALTATTTPLGLPVTFSVVSGPATISGTTLTFTGAGTVVVAANGPGNASYSAAPQLTQNVVVTINPNVTTLTSSLNPSDSGQAVIFTSLVNTGGIAPTGSVTFSDGATSIGTGTIAPAGATNLLPNSELLSAWGTDMTGAAAPHLVASALADPLGGTKTVEMDFPANALNGNAWLANFSYSGTGPAYTASIWLRAPAPTTITFQINDTAGTFEYSDLTVAVGTQWQRYQVSFTLPNGDTAQTLVLCFKNPSTAANTIDVFGAQIEQAATSGPYVRTTGASISGSGGIATLVTSALAVGSHSITAQYGGDAGNATSTSTVLSQVVNPSIVVTPAAPTIITQGKSTSFTAATATGGNAPLLFSIAPTLPAGLTLSATTGVISGTATGSTSLISYTVTATDTNLVTGSAVFSLTAAPLITAVTNVPSTTLTQGHAAASFTPVTASGGDGTLTLSVSPLLPAGLSFSTSTGLISGTATVSSPITSYTVTAIDLNTATGSAIFNLAVDGPVVVTGLPTIITQGKSTTFTSATATGGLAPLSFAATTPLPTGLTMSTSGIVTGTATASSVATPYTVTVTDFNGATGTTTFSLTVDPSIVPTPTTFSKTLTQGAAANFTPITATGGDGPLSFTASLPVGLTMAGNGAITGAPASASVATPYTITITDINGATSNATLTLTVDSVIVPTPTTFSKTLTQGYAVNFTPITGSGGDGTLTFASTLPTGLTMSPTGTITGAAAAASLATPYTVTISDVNGASAMATLTLTVDSSISAITVIPSTILTQGHTSPAFTPVTTSGGDGTLTLAVSPTLPTGLTFSTSTGLISGTSTAAITATTFTVTATDVNGATGSSNFSLTVDPSITVTPASPTILTQGKSASFPAGSATGGDGALVFSVSPNLPAGLGLSSSTGIISGTATVSIPQTSFTLTAMDLNGATGTASFSLIVDAPIVVTGLPIIITQGKSTTFTAATATGGDAPLNFVATTTLPVGLSMSMSGVVTGNATLPSLATPYTVTVTDANGAIGSTTFSLTVDSAILITPSTSSKTLTKGYAASFTPATASGGDGTLTFTIAPLPTGLSMSPAGLITGTATVTSLATPYTITVTDLNSAATTATLTLTVDSSITAINVIPSTTLTQGHASTSFTPVTASGGDGTLTLAVSPALPTGLIFSTSTGLISGTATASISATTFTVTATDLNGATGNASFGLTVDPSISVTPTTAAKTLTQGYAASFTPMTATGGDGTLGFTISPALPTGLAMSTSGLIAGTDAATLTANAYTVTVTDQNGATSTATLTLTVDSSITMTPTTAAKTLTQGAAVSFTPIIAGGGDGTLTITAPTLPAGLSMNSTGTISGTPTATSPATPYNVTATDQNGAAATAVLTLAVNSSINATPSTAARTLTQGYTASFTPVAASGGFGTLGFSISPALPTGLAISATGAITGTDISTLTTTSYTITVTDQNTASATATLTLTVDPSITATTVIATTTLTQGHTSSAFAPVTASGGDETLTFAVSPALPTGLTFSTSTGLISGTSTAAITATTFTVTATDVNGATGASSFSLTVDPSIALTPTTASKILTQGAPATFTPITAVGGDGTLTFSISPTLPNGLSLTSVGLIAGTPTAAMAQSTYTITVTDQNSATATGTLNLTVDSLVILTPSTASRTLTQGFAASFTPMAASGGDGALTFAAPSLPTGLSISTGGVVTGIATTQSSSATYTVTVTDVNGGTATGTLNLTVDASITVTPALPTTITQGKSTTFTAATANGGDTPLSFAATTALPTGLVMSTSGIVTGTATASSLAAPFTVTVTDANGATGTTSFSLAVDASILVTPSSPTIITQGKSTTFTAATATGGDAPLTFTATLPAGLVMSTSGVVTGTATTSSLAASFSVTVTDTNGATGTGSFSLAVDPPITVTPGMATIITQGKSVSFMTATATGGDAPLTFTATLPTGLTMDTNGAVTGTATTASAASLYLITVTDANGATGTASFSLAVDNAVVAVSAIPSTTMTQGHATPFTPVTATGGDGTLTFTVSPTLSAGLSMAANGLISGTPTITLSVSSFTVTATDLNGATATAPFTLIVDSAITATTVIPTTTMTQGNPSPFTPVTAAGGDGTLVLTVSPTLPAGLSMNSAGQISGTPSATLPITLFTVTATDLNNAIATATFSLTVDSPITATTVVASTIMTQGHAVPFTPIAASGGNAPLILSVSPSLPAGLSMAANGGISGTPTALLSQSSFTVTATDQDGATANATFNLSIDSSIIATSVVPSTTVTQNHAAAAFAPVTATGGNGTLTYTVGPTLPGNLSMSNTGIITGTATSSLAQSSFTVTVTDQDGATATAAFNLTVDSSITATTVISATAVTQGHASAPFTPVTASGGDGTLSLTVSPTLPAGLSLSSNGSISGAASVALTATTFTVTATDQNGATATAAFSLTVDSAVNATTLVPSTILTKNLATGSPFTPVAVSGGDGQLTLAISPALPTGLAMSPTGIISGMATVPLASTTFTITATDVNDASASATFSLTVNPLAAMTMVPATSLTVGAPAIAFIPVIGLGGSTPLAYSLSPALPGGLTMKLTTGAISGTPTVAMLATNYVVTVTDATNATATAGFTLIVDSPVVETTIIPITTLTQTVAASFTPVTATGGFNPIIYGVTPALPAGLSISTTTGTISGTPTAATAGATYHVTAIDANGGAANPTKTFNLTVDAAVAAATAVPSVSLLRDQTATAFTPVTVTGGFAPLTYTVSPLLPTGLILAAHTGVISGTPSISIGATTYAVTVTDSNGDTATASFTLTVTGSTIAATTTIPQVTLMQSTVASSFIPVTSSGGVGTLKFTISPSLPSGLSVAGATGAITGTPLVALATSTYTITVTDATQTSGSASFSLTVNPALTATLLSSTNALTENNPSSFTPVAGSGGTAPLSYSVLPALPAGLTMNTLTGVISGAPSVALASTSFTMTVTDAAGVKVTKAFNISVATPVTATTAIATTTLSQGVAKSAFTPVAGAGGVGTRTFSVLPTLPTGLTFAANGSISGTAAAGSAATIYTVTVTDVNLAAASNVFSLTVTPSN